MIRGISKNYLSYVLHRRTSAGFFQPYNYHKFYDAYINIGWYDRLFYETIIILSLRYKSDNNVKLRHIITMDYNAAEEFFLIQSNEDPANPFVRLRCDRRLHTATLDNRPNMWTLYTMHIGYYKKQYWSTNWLDIVFNTSQAERLNVIKHRIYIMDMPNPANMTAYIATPSLLYPGYFRLHLQDRPNDRWSSAVYFLCPVRWYRNEASRKSFLVALTDEEVQRLDERNKINNEFERRRKIYEYLLII